MKNKKRIWIALLLFGLLGQLAWTIENMYFNVFVYNTISNDVTIIASMVAASAVTATVTTLLMGALSDKVGKRKVFITIGYVVWGLSVIAFAFLDVETVGKLFPTVAAVSTAGILAVVMDCIMTFFGSTANDACFNAWITDVVDSSDRSKYETVLATLPLISMLLVFGLLDGLTQAGKWSEFFLVIGGCVSIGGILGSFFIKDVEIKKSSESFMSNLAYGFSIKVIKENKTLYLSLICLLVLSISTQIFMPYMIIYIEAYLHIQNYAIILGIVLLVASLISVLVGRIIDKVGNDLFFIPSVIVLFIGSMLMYFVRQPYMVVIAGIVMMSGNLIVSALINGNIRNFTPANKAGGFQGIRMIFAVMLPMIIGPFIGASVIKSSSLTYTDLGTIKQVPNESIFLASAICILFIFIPYFLLTKQQAKLKKKHHNLLTTYGENLDDKNVLPEYPRPQFVRDSYINLNGHWQYAINQKEELPTSFEGDVLVPFSIESTLSKVNRTLKANDILWYKTNFTLAKTFVKDLVYLNFGAVDQSCWIYINKQLVKEHQGGYLPFSVEISSYLQDTNELIVKVKDVTDNGGFAYGKQSSKRGGIWYTPTSGIWQTVWLESTYTQHIDSIKIDCDYDNSDLLLHINGNEERYQVEVKANNAVIFKATVDNDSKIHINDKHDWSPEDPFLYSLEIAGSKDKIKSYFAMRKFSICSDKHGVRRIHLNNKPYFCKGVLDQGYYSDGIYTPASYQAMIDDIKLVKSMGFNTIRKHIKIEPLRWYYYCDTMGVIVWQDMVSGGDKYHFAITSVLPFLNINLKDNHYGLFARKSQQSRDMYYSDLKETISLLYNVPSLGLWVPFNEGWGQFDALKAYDLIKQLDNSRIIDHASGWHDQKGGDLFSKHIYFSKINFKEDERVWALTEYGGYSYSCKSHCYNDANFGYKVYQNTLDLQAAFLQLHSEEVLPLIPEGLSATIYTQLSDVEDEVNGLVTYDRKVIKFDCKVIKTILDKMVIPS